MFVLGQLAGSCTEEVDEEEGGRFLAIGEHSSKTHFSTQTPKAALVDASISGGED